MDNTSTGCQTCDQNESGVVKCHECDQFLCSACLKSHSRFSTTKTHKVVPIEQYLQLPPYIFEFRLYCPLHKFENDTFCVVHDQPCCKTCINTTHKNCRDLPPLSEITKECTSEIDATKIRLIEIGKYLQQRHTRTLPDVKELKLACPRLKNEIKEFRSKIDQRLDVLEEELLQNLYSVELQIDQKSRTFTDAEDKITELSDNLNEIVKYASPLECFLGNRYIQSEIADEESRIEELDSNETVNLDSISFRSNDHILKFVNNAENFGEILKTAHLPSCPFTRSTKHIQLLPSTKHSFNINLALMKAFRVNVGPNKYINGCAVSIDGKYLFIERCFYSSSGSLILCSETGQLECIIQLYEQPHDMSCIDDHTVAISSSDNPKIMLVDLKSKTIRDTIDTRYKCYGIAYYEDNLFLNYGEYGIEAIDISNQYAKPLSLLALGGCSYITIFSNRIYGIDKKNNKVTCSTMDGKVIWVWTEMQNEQSLSDITVDSDGHSFIASRDSHIIIVVSNDGKLSKSVSLEKVDKPKCVFFDVCGEQLLVCSAEGDVGIYSIKYIKT